MFPHRHVQAIEIEVDQDLMIDVQIIIIDEAIRDHVHRVIETKTIQTIDQDVMILIVVVIRMAAVQDILIEN